ncbi:MAG TPA: CU044_5270 family protein [Actinomycetota bacterium]|nr:CU044_5270 family protein [Actinomycetota bacterium]
MKTNETMTRLVAADPISDDDVADWASTEEGRQVFEELLVGVPRIARRQRGAKVPARALALAAAVVVIFGVVALWPDDPERKGPRVVRTEDHDVLHGAALVAARREGVSAGPGQFVYRKFQGQGTGTQDVNGRQITALLPTTIEVWISHDDGSGRVLGDVKGPKFTSTEDEQWWIDAGSPAFADVGTFEKVLPSSDYPREDLDAYPTDPDELYSFLSDKAKAVSCRSTSPQPEQCPPGEDPDEAVFWRASEILLNHPDAGPDLRSALFEVLSRVPGTEISSEAVDPTGRPASMASIRIGEDGGRSQRHEIYFDPEQAEMLGFRNVFTEPDGRETTYSYSVLVDWGVVDSVPERP